MYFQVTGDSEITSRQFAKYRTTNCNFKTRIVWVNMLHCAAGVCHPAADRLILCYESEAQSCCGNWCFFLLLNLLRNTWTHHLTVLEDEQEGDGLNALSQALQDVWVLQNPKRQTNPGTFFKENMQSSTLEVPGDSVGHLPVRISQLEEIILLFGTCIGL